MAKKKSPYPDTGIITLKHTVKNNGVEEVREVVVEADTSEQEKDIARELLETMKAVSPAALQQTVKAAEESLLPLSKLIEKYTEEKEEDWTGETTYEFAGIFKRLIDIIGDLPVGNVGFVQARYYKDTLKNLPPHMNKISKYKGMSIEQVIATKPAKTLGVATINKNLSTISSLFDWARRHHYVAENYFANLGIRQKKGSKSKYKPFTSDDLHRLFSTDIYTAGQYKLPFRYWIPLISLFSGARLEEICRLRLIDLQEVDGIPCFIITEDEESDSRLKNENSSRIIPIHSELIRLGLLRYAAFLDKKIRKQEMKRLFPELTPNKDGKFYRKPSRWFNDTYRPECGVTAPGQVFHSFRHTVNDKLKQNPSIDRAYIKAILGHSTSDMTDYYGSSYGPAVLQPVIEMLVYELPEIRPFI